MRARRSMTTYSNYSCTRILVDGPPTRVRISRSLLALLTYEYPGGYGLNNVEHRHLGIALLRFAAVSIQRNRVVSLDKSILYLQFLCKTSDSTFVLVVHDYVWDRFCCQCTEVNNVLTGPTPQVTNHKRQMRSLYVQENAHNYFVFHSIFTRFVAFREKTFIYNLLTYVLEKFSLWNWEKLSYCRVTCFQLWQFVFFTQSSLYC